MPPVTPAPDPLSLPEMLRVMDVATELRHDRELVESQLNRDALRAKLREKMIAAAAVTGEEVTPEEVDAAIERYYANLYEYHDPPLSPAVALAHLYVRRVAIAKWGGLAVGSVLLVWWLFLSASGPLSGTGRAQREIASLAAEFDRRRDAVKAVSADGGVGVAAELGQLQAEADTFRRQGDAAKLREATARLADLERRLGEEYNVTAVQKPRSVVTRGVYEGGKAKVSAYYVIVQAKGKGGAPLTRRVHDAETGQDADVSTWGERVPKEVYDRLAADKQADGILDETAFAEKRRGRADEDVVMKGADGQPLKRLGQITTW